MKITLYSRAGCHLCEDAREILEEGAERARRAGREVEVEEVDIDASPALRLRYAFDVPVVAIDGQEAFRHFVSADELWKRLNHT